MNFSNYLSTCASYFHSQKKESEIQYCHGSTFSALYLMGRLKGENHNALVSYGDLENSKIPVFSGECFRGIADNGINRINTSWADIKNSHMAVDYSKTFPFSFEETKKCLTDIIKNNEAHLNGTGWSSPPYAFYNSPYWNKILLRIRQVRAWDEQNFQDELKNGLIRWLEAEIVFMARPNRRESRDDYHYERLHNILDEINSPVAFQLNEEDKVSLLKTYPIVFLTSSCGEIYVSNWEIAVVKKLRLGEDIQGIATAPEFMEEVQAHLRQQGLAKKVTVISFAALALEKMNQALPKLSK